MIEHFLSPLDSEEFEIPEQYPGFLINHLRINNGTYPDMDQVKVAIVGIIDKRFDGLNYGTSLGPDKIRKELYSLMKPQHFGVVADIGNIEAGETAQDTLFAIQTVLQELQSLGICTVILGGTENFALQQYRCLKEKRSHIQLVYTGSRVNLRDDSWLHDVVLDDPNHLFNLAALGFQTYLCEQESLDAVDRMFFDQLRLGQLRDQMQIAEPYFRQADMAVFDMSAIKQGDSPGYHQASPNGLRSEEACQLARFAGLGHQLNSVGFYNYNPDYDRDKQSAKLAAQMCWFYLEAFFSRRREDPLQDNENFMKYRLNLKQHELVFYKSKLTDRWWMEIPHPRSNRENTFPLMVPCLYNDYMEAANDELPDRWWRMFQKYS